MEESWRRNHGGIMKEESWRNHGGGIMEESWRRNHGGIMKEESWKRNLAGGSMEEESWRRDHGGGIIEKGNGKNLGGIWEASGWHLGGIWEASGRLGRPWGLKGILEAKCVKTYVFFLIKVARATISRRRERGDPHEVRSLRTKVIQRRSPRSCFTSTPVLRESARTPTV